MVLAGPLVATLACSEPVQPRLIDDPVLPATRRVIAVATGFSSSCALTQSGRMYCWGENRFGELGDSSRVPHSAPIPVHTESTFTFITGTQGTSRSCAITPSGAAYCWGYNLNGELGDGSTVDAWVPARVGGDVTFAAISSSYHTCALSLTGAAYCWGLDLAGALGRGPGPYGDITVPGAVATTTAYTHITTGLEFTCALDSGGRAYCWGWGAMVGAGGSPDTVYHEPTPVLTEQRFVTLSAAEEHTCGVTAARAVYCWGKIGGAFDSISTTPERIRTLPPVQQVLGGRQTSCALTPAGRVICGSLRGPGLQFVADSIRFAGLSVGNGHACGFTPGGAVFCWGQNWAGQLGDGTGQYPLTPLTPVRVALP
jgi:alpha-tubulin suppressor-like RCC1 family protein